MNKILSIIVLSVFYTANVNATESDESYASALKQYVHESSKQKSPFSDEDMAIMQKAGEQLFRDMPSPGIKVGKKAPDFTLGNAFGEQVSLKELLKMGPVVLVFYRGAWCPFCNLHLHALHKRLPEMKKYGAQLVLVTPQTPDKSAEQIRKDEYTFEVLSDLDSQVMKDYHLYFELPDELQVVYKKHGLDIEAFNGAGRAVLPVPGSFVIDQQGIIRAMHAETDYKKRMEPSEIISTLDKIK